MCENLDVDIEISCTPLIILFRKWVFAVLSPIIITLSICLQGFQTSMYASSWFLTLFTTALNLNLICCRIMDVFLSEGMEVIFKLALALLTIGKETVLSLDMEAMLKVSQRGSGYQSCAVNKIILITITKIIFVFAVFPERAAGES